MQNGYTVETKEVEKNGVTRIGYIIKKENSENKVSPMFYDFPNDVDEAFEYIVKYMPTNTDNSFEDYLTEEYARRNVYLIALTEGKNKNFVTRPSQFKGIEMGLAFDVTVEGISGMVRITNSLAEGYKNLEELWDIATKNTASDIQIEGFPFSFDDGMFTMSNHTNNMGASTMFTNRAKEMLKTKFENSATRIALLPSSIHEWVIFPIFDTLNIEPSQLVEMVKAVNATMVEESERLTDNAYIYDLEENTITSLV